MVEIDHRFELHLLVIFLLKQRLSSQALSAHCLELHLTL